MVRFTYRLALMVCGLLVLLSCSKEKKGDETLSGARSKRGEKTFLDVHAILGSTPEELMERFGEPKPYIPEREGASDGYMTWKDLYGVRVFAVIRDGRCAYVHYQFNEMDPFDEEAAFGIVGIERPEHEPELIPQSEAKKWKPFEHYDRLTVSPKTKGVAVRAYAFKF